MKTPTLRLWPRPWTKRDWGAILNLETLCHADPWTELEFLHQFARGDHVNCRVVEDGIDGPLLGYMVYVNKATSYRILNIATHPAYRRMGAGGELVKCLKRKVTNPAFGARRIIADLSERNLAGQMFFKALGFVCARVFPNRFEGSAGYEDAYRFIWE